MPRLSISPLPLPSRPSAYTQSRSRIWSAFPSFASWTVLRIVSTVSSPSEKPVVSSNLSVLGLLVDVRLCCFLRSSRERFFVSRLLNVCEPSSILASVHMTSAFFPAGALRYVEGSARAKPLIKRVMFRQYLEATGGLRAA